MKLHTGTNVIEKSGQFEESKFSIEASAKAFFILSDGLYSNKILAVIRELSTNAYDSHVEAGKASTPFDVHIPTHLQPVFFIRDYGTGMTHEDCMQLYTTYFRSTRNNSNEAVGCLGLGSKAPFAYADSFTVEAYLDGTRRIYTAYKNEDGSPVFSLLEETVTSEPNGIKVSINVSSNDVNRFHNEAVRVYEYFNVKPNFIGQKLSFRNIDKVLSGKNWYFDDNASDNLIIMGQIAYPVDTYQLVANLDKSFERHRKFIEYSEGLRIFVKIGDVDITPSRESLSYSRETKNNILTVVDSITNEIKDKIEEQIANQPSLFKARMKYVQISNQCSSISTAMESLQKSITWKDMKLFDSVAGEYINTKDKILLNSLEKSAYRSKIDIKYGVERMCFGDNVKFFIDNLGRGGLSRIRQYMKNLGVSQVSYVYKLKDNETIDNCNLLAMMGGASKEDVVLTSTLDKVNYNRNTNYSGGSSEPTVQIQMFNEETGHFEDCKMSVKYENAHYFKESKDTIDLGYGQISVGYLSKILEYAHKNYADMISDATFYIIKPSVIKNRKLEERDNWHDGSKLIGEIFNKAVATNKKNIIECQKRYYLSAQRHDRWKDCIAMTTTDNELKRIVCEHEVHMKEINAMRDDMITIYEVSRSFASVESINFSGIKLDDEMYSKRFDEEIKKYPMLRLLSNVWSDQDRKLVAGYIDTVNVGANAMNVLNAM
jgi:hypothetical protein